MLTFSALLLVVSILQMIEANGVAALVSMVLESEDWDTVRAAMLSLGKLSQQRAAHTSLLENK